MKIASWHHSSSGASAVHRNIKVLSDFRHTQDEKIISLQKCTNTINHERNKQPQVPPLSLLL